MLLSLSSCLFGTVVIHASLVQAHDLHFIFVFVTMLSILYHSNKTSIMFQENPKVFKCIHVLDVCFAHIAFCYMTIRMLLYKSPLLIFSVIMLLIWRHINKNELIQSTLLNETQLKNTMYWHVLFHVVGVMAVHLFLLLH